MTDTTVTAGDLVAGATGKPAPRRNPGDWPLAGDVISHRAGVPEHLIRRRRATGDGDPAPML